MVDVLVTDKFARLEGTVATNILRARSLARFTTNLALLACEIKLRNKACSTDQ